MIKKIEEADLIHIANIYPDHQAMAVADVLLTKINDIIDYINEQSSSSSEQEKRKEKE